MVVVAICCPCDAIDLGHLVEEGVDSSLSILSDYCIDDSLHGWLCTSVDIKRLHAFMATHVISCISDSFRDQRGQSAETHKNFKNHAPCPNKKWRISQCMSLSVIASLVSHRTPHWAPELHDTCAQSRSRPGSRSGWVLPLLLVAHEESQMLRKLAVLVLLASANIDINQSVYSNINHSVYTNINHSIYIVLLINHRRCFHLL